MIKNSTAPKIVFVLVLIILLTAVSSFFLIVNSDTEEKKISVDEIQKIISIDQRSSGINFENIVVTKSSSNFLRGTLKDLDDGLEKDFFLIKIGDIWRVVDVTNFSVSCERFARLGFPNTFIQDCKLSFSDAVKISEIDATLEEFFLSSQNTNLKIIGDVESVEYTENGQIVTIISGGEEVHLQLSVNDPVVEKGDLIVTTITPPNNNSTEKADNTDKTYSASNVVVVNDVDKDLFIENNVVNQNPATNIDLNNPNELENKIFKINAPKSYAPPSYFKNVYDQNNSFIEVELDGSF